MIRQFNVIVCLVKMSNVKEQHCETKANITKFTWTIKDFSTLLDISSKNCLMSSPFTMECDDVDKLVYWRLVFVPKISGDFCSLFAEILADNGSFNTHIKLAILDSKGRPAIFKKLAPEIDLDENPEYMSFGSFKFIRSTYLKSKKEKLFPNDTLTITCEILLITDSLLPSTDERFSHVERNIYKDLEAMKEHELFQDVTLLTERVPLKANSVILSARSSVFASLLSQPGTKEKKNKYLVINDVEQDVMNEVLDFMYTDDCPKLKDMAWLLLKVANDYDIGGLKELCEIELISQVIVGNVAHLLILANKNSAESLKEKAMEFIKSHINEVAGSAGWKHLIEFHPDLLEQIVSH